jgi:uncharacterized protein YeaO (DUF488 family)
MKLGLGENFTQVLSLTEKETIMFYIKRIYEAPKSKDGARYLVDRLWPRGIKKTSLIMDAWLKEIAPSNELRRWFGHDPEKWDEFQRRYRSELDANPGVWKRLLEAVKQGNVTLLYFARDTEHNNAVVLKSYLEEHLAT